MWLSTFTQQCFPNLTFTFYQCVTKVEMAKKLPPANVMWSSLAEYSTASQHIGSWGRRIVDLRPVEKGLGQPWLHQKTTSQKVNNKKNVMTKGTQWCFVLQHFTWKSWPLYKKLQRCKMDWGIYPLPPAVLSYVKYSTAWKHIPHWYGVCAALCHFVTCKFM